MGQSIGMDEFITYGHSNWGPESPLLWRSRLAPAFRTSRTKRRKSAANFFFITFLTTSTCGHASAVSGTALSDENGVCRRRFNPFAVLANQILQSIHRFRFWDIELNGGFAPAEIHFFTSRAPVTPNTNP